MLSLVLLYIGNGLGVFPLSALAPYMSTRRACIRRGVHVYTHKCWQPSNKKRIYGARKIEMVLNDYFSPA
jgi:hypothetical protein